MKKNISFITAITCAFFISGLGFASSASADQVKPSDVTTITAGWASQVSFNEGGDPKNDDDIIYETSPDRTISEFSATIRNPNKNPDKTFEISIKDGVLEVENEPTPSPETQQRFQNGLAILALEKRADDRTEHNEILLAIRNLIIDEVVPKKR